MEKLSAVGQAQVNKVLKTVQKRIVTESLQEVMDTSDSSGVEHTFEELVPVVTRKCVAKGV